METVVLVLILIILLGVLLAICFNWNRMMCDCLKNPKNKTVEGTSPVEEKPNNKYFQNPDHSSLPINDQQERQQNDDTQKVNGKEESKIQFPSDDDDDQVGTKFVRFKLEQNVYDNMKICMNEVIYERREKGKRESRKFYKTGYDLQYNEYYQCHEENEKPPYLRIFIGKTNKILYQGNNDKQQFINQINNQEKKYNQILPKESFQQLPIQVINAFTLLLNLQEQEFYFRSNKQQQIFKRKWFVPNDCTENLKSFFWQFEPLGYNVKDFSEAIYFIQQDEQHIFFAEVNFSNTLFIHSTHPKSLDQYTPLLQQLNQFFNNILEYTNICFKCKDNQADDFKICLNMLNYSNSQLKATIQTTSQMQDFIKQQFYKQF